MGNVISYSDFLLKKQEQLDDRNAILTIAALPLAEAIIKDAGLECLNFRLNRKSELLFKKKPITYKEPDGSFSDIYYDAKTQDAIYRVECKVSIDIDTESVSVDTNLYKLENYQNGNREWLYFRKHNNNHSWLIGPGEDFFDLQEFLSGGM